MNLGDQQSIKFEIWDTAGQERYKSLAPMYYRGAAAAVIVYDITNMDSYIRAKNWVQELQRQGDSSVVIALAGNKSDLSENRVVETAEAQAYADEKNLVFYECSAKANVNINDIFISIGMSLLASLTALSSQEVVVHPSAALSHTRLKHTAKKLPTARSGEKDRAPPVAIGGKTRVC